MKSACPARPTGSPSTVGHGRRLRIADIAIFPWVRNLVGFYGAGDLVSFADFAQVGRALATFMDRPAVARGLLVPAQLAGVGG